jgi:transcriptional regulator with XRE-family HTH domain
MKNTHADWNNSLIEAEENFVIDAQFLLADLLEKKGLSRKELAEISGMSKARISQIFHSEANPTAKTLVRLFFALGEKIELKNCKENLRSSRAKLSSWEFEWDAEKEVQSKTERHEIRRYASVLLAENDNGPSAVEWAHSFRLKALIAA